MFPWVVASCCRSRRSRVPQRQARGSRSVDLAHIAAMTVPLPFHNPSGRTSVWKNVKMWHDHLLPFRELSYGSISILVTWPYHRTLRYFTLDPAARLSDDMHSNVDDLTGAINHWHLAKEMEFDFVRKAVFTRNAIFFHVGLL